MTNHISTTGSFQQPLLIEVITRFSEQFDPSYTEEILHHTFAFAAIGGLDEDSYPISIKEVALHFDQLIALVKALSACRDSGATLLNQLQEDSHE